MQNKFKNFSVNIGYYITGGQNKLQGELPPPEVYLDSTQTAHEYNQTYEGLLFYAMKIIL